jgi:hypothetical protein
MEDLATLVRLPSGTLEIFEGPRVAIPTAALNGLTEIRVDSSTLESKLLVSPSISPIFNQINHPQFMDPPMQGLTVIPDGETERLLGQQRVCGLGEDGRGEASNNPASGRDLSASPGTDPLEVLDHVCDQITSDQPCINPINTLSGPTEEYVSTPRPDSLLVDDRQCTDTNTLAFPTPNRIPTSSPTTFCVLAPQDKLHLALTSWLRNMEKLSHFLDRLQKIASSALAEHQSRQVATLRATFKRQQEHFIEFLHSSEDFICRYLLDISAEIQRQSSYLAVLKRRLNMAKDLRRQIVDLRRTYESVTIATMRDVRTKGKEFSSHLSS